MQSISTRNPSPGRPAAWIVVRAGRCSPNIARVDGVHLLEFLHVDQEHAAAQHVLQIGAARLQDRLQVLQALLGLRLDVGAGQLAGRRIGRALPGDEDETFEAHAR